MLIAHPDNSLGQVWQKMDKPFREFYSDRQAMILPLAGKFVNQVGNFSVFDEKNCYVTQPVTPQQLVQENSTKHLIRSHVLFAITICQVLLDAN